MQPTAKAEEDLDDDDDAAPGEGKLQKQAAVTGGASLDVCYVQVLHRRVEKAHGTALFNAYVPRLFGTPFVLSMRVAQYTAEALYAEVWMRVKHLISHDYHLHKDDAAPEFPFRLSVVDHSGRACGVCHWNKMCLGCALSDRHIDIERGLVLAIDWHLPVLRLYYNNELANRSDMHASVQQNRDLQDYPVSLDECLRLFSAEEQLEDWYCGKCKKHGTATKSLAVFRLPTVLALHLKRFQLHRNEWTKTNKLVHFPLRGLALGPPQQTHALYATISHFGGMGGGHYTAYARSAAADQDDSFYYFDDSRYRAVEDPNHVVTRAAYVLFYVADDGGAAASQALQKVWRWLCFVCSFI
jgi:hypothetical protein